MTLYIHNVPINTLSYPIRQRKGGVPPIKRKPRRWSLRGFHLVPHGHCFQFCLTALYHVFIFVTIFIFVLCNMSREMEIQMKIHYICILLFQSIFMLSLLFQSRNLIHIHILISDKFLIIWESCNFYTDRHLWISWCSPDQRQFCPLDCIFFIYEAKGYHCIIIVAYHTPCADTDIFTIHLHSISFINKTVILHIFHKLNFITP